MYSAFMELCENKDFDTAIACGVLERMDPSKEFEYAPKWKGTIYSPMWFTPLSMAVFYNNLKMVQLLDQAIAYWLVLFGFGGVTKDDKLSVRMCDGLEPSMFKEFINLLISLSRPLASIGLASQRTRLIMEYFQCSDWKFRGFRERAWQRA